MTSKPFSKGHDAAALRGALRSSSKDFGAVKLTGIMRLVNPRAAFLADDDHDHSLPAPPQDDSLETARELFEVVLAVRAADTPFDALEPFREQLETVFPSPAGVPVPAFRYSGGHRGPYVSRLLQVPVPINGTAVLQQYRTRLGRYGVTPETNREILAGRIPRPQQLDDPNVHITTPRLLASWVHQDPPYLLGLYAAMILEGLGIARRPEMFRPGTSPSEVPFVTQGGAVDLHCAVAEVTRLVMQYAWRLKWLGWGMMRRRRPEELMADQGSLHPIWREKVVPLLRPEERQGMPRLYAEGCPLHPDYPSGHAAIGGAIATLLKAWFVDGPWPGMPELSIHGELDKLAANLGWGRNFAGIHYRSSCRGGMLLGEAVALELLEEWAGRSVSFVGFDGQPVSVGDD
jgi:membrane-associated phospholipid phosphatase